MNKSINNLDDLVISLGTIFISLIPIALLTGPFLPDLLLSIVALLFLFQIIKNREWTYFNNNFVKILSIFYFIAILSSFLSSNIFLSLESSFFYFRFLIFSIAVWFVIDNNKNFINIFAITLLFAFLVSIIDGYYQYFFDINLFGFKAEGVRMSLLLNDKMLLGGFLVRLFPLLIAIYLFHKKHNIYFLFLISLLFILIDVLIYLSGERTSFALLAILTIFIILLISRYKILRIVTFAISILLVVFLTIFSSDIRERNINQTLSQLGVDQEKHISVFSPRHESHYISALKMFIENPMIGVGPKIFRQLCSEEKYNVNEDSCSTHPHNTYIQILAEMGIIGFSVFIIIPIYLVSKIITHIYQYFRNGIRLLSDYQICLIGCFLLTLWPLAPTLSFFNNWISVVYYLPIGFFLSTIYNNKTH